MSSSPLVAFNNVTSELSEENQNTSTSPFQSMKPSILIILVILSITIFLCISLCLLLRHLNHRLIGHLPPATTTTMTNISHSSSSNYRHSSNRISPEFCSIIDSLPLFTFSSVKHRSASTGDCAVCLSSFEPQDQLRLLPLCCHAFHSHCIDTWLLNNQTCPLCRSSIHASESDINKALQSTATNDGVTRAGSFRLEIGSISRRQQSLSDTTAAHNRTSYSIGSFDYIVDEESEVSMTNTHQRILPEKVADTGAPQATQEHSVAAEIASSTGNGGWSWVKDYVDRLSSSLSASTSRAMSFRNSGRFFAGSSRQSEAVAAAGAGDYDLEQASRAGEEISEVFRWLSGV